jgi:hypothetical protein
VQPCAASTPPGAAQGSRAGPPQVPAPAATHGGEQDAGDAGHGRARVHELGLHVPAGQGGGKETQHVGRGLPGDRHSPAALAAPRQQCCSLRPGAGEAGRVPGCCRRAPLEGLGLLAEVQGVEAVVAGQAAAGDQPSDQRAAASRRGAPLPR